MYFTAAYKVQMNKTYIGIKTERAVVFNFKRNQNKNLRSFEAANSFEIL